MSIRIVYATLLLAASVACGSSSPSTPTPTPAPSGSSATASIVAGSATLTSTAYSPNPVTVAIGGTVTWVNNDVVAHTSTANGGAWNSGSIAPGGRFAMTYPTAGSFPYHCAIHPGMIGTVTVQ
jgi:plastocyanin